MWARRRLFLKVKQTTSAVLVLKPAAQKVKMLVNDDVNAAALRTRDQVLSFFGLFCFHIKAFLSRSVLPATARSDRRRLTHADRRYFAQEAPLFFGIITMRGPIYLQLTGRNATIAQTLLHNFHVAAFNIH